MGAASALQGAWTRSPPQLGGRRAGSTWSPVVCIAGRGAGKQQSAGPGYGACRVQPRRDRSPRAPIQTACVDLGLDLRGRVKFPRHE